MEQYINKSALIAEIERRIKERDFQMKSGCWISSTYMYEDLLDFINTLEVKEANEALRTEYEKGRADVIAEIEKCYEKAITAEAQTYLIKDLLDRLKTKK